MLQDGTPIAVTSCYGDPTVRIWNLVSRAPIGEPLVGHSTGVGSIACTVLPDGTAVAATAGYDATVRLWNLESRTPIGRPIVGHGDWVRAVTFGILPDGAPVIVSAGDDAMMRFWSLTTFRQSYAVPLSDVMAIASIGPGKLIVGAGIDVSCWYHINIDD
jgi:WD40 repeat protein